jgi:putative phosphoesterase
VKAPARVAALYDIHGNLPALEAVLDEVRRAGVDQVVVGGDVVLGPMPIETIQALTDLDLPTRFIRGNCDREVLAWSRGTESAAILGPYRELMRWNARQLRPEDQRRIEAWPLTLTLKIDGLGSVLFCHATPRDDNEIITPRTTEDQLAPILAGVRADVIVCGHTHKQFDRSVGAIRIVNAGSVGMPFEEPCAYWLLLGPDVQLRRTPYDFAAAAERIRATACPSREEFTASYVLKPTE